MTNILGLGLTAVVAAMDEELEPLRARLAGRTSASVGGARVTLGHLGRAPVVLAATGDGERNARRGLADLLAKLPVQRVLAIGVAGALTPELGVASILIGDVVVGEREGALHHAGSALARAAARACVGRRGVVVTAAKIADTAAEKQRLASLALAVTGGDARGAVVDLESAAFAAEAERAGVPWLVLRAVSDTAVEALPALLNRSRDDGGAVRRGRVVLGLLGEPRSLFRLLELRARVGVCAGDLGRAVELTLAELAAAEPQRAPVQAAVDGWGAAVPAAGRDA